MIFVHPDGRVIPLAYHSDKDLKPGIMRRIVRDAGVAADEFRELMK
jgi:predicted RNA binding protein YcfA (HicA-like mRNA interferase family)